MQAASRESIAALIKTFDGAVAELDDAGLSTTADELAAVSRLLVNEISLRKTLAARTDDSSPKLAVVSSLFGSRVSATTAGVLEKAVALRWSKSRDLVRALERLARIGVIISAERADQVENVEDELFRFGRVLESNTKLSGLLGDTSASADRRIALLEDVLAGKTTKYTSALLAQAVRGSDGSHLADVVVGLAELAAARRNESVAHVTAPVALTSEQTTRLTAVLSKIYGKKISIQTDIDPSIIGGLKINLGGEVIDGSVASRLAAAANEIPR